MSGAPINSINAKSERNNHAQDNIMAELAQRAMLSQSWMERHEESQAYLAES